LNKILLQLYRIVFKFPKLCFGLQHIFEGMIECVVRLDEYI
jgi:hypothetical protein